MQSQCHHLAQMDCQQQPMVQHFVKEMTKFTRFIEAPCFLVFSVISGEA